MENITISILTVCWIETYHDAVDEPGDDTADDDTEYDYEY